MSYDTSCKFTPYSPNVLTIYTHTDSEKKEVYDIDMQDALPHVQTPNNTIYGSSSSTKRQFFGETASQTVNESVKKRGLPSCYSKHFVYWSKPESDGKLVWYRKQKKEHDEPTNLYNLPPSVKEYAALSEKVQDAKVYNLDLISRIEDLLKHPNVQAIYSLSMLDVLPEDMRGERVR